jgi:trimethylamine--corrinoid protein Co-methyltransferase
MIVHPRTYIEQLTAEQVDLILTSAMQLLEQRGMRIDNEAACRLLVDAGASLDAQGRVLINPDLVQKALSQAPGSFTLHARNSQRSVTVGGGQMLLCPGYGSPFVSTSQQERRPALMADFDKFVALAARSPLIDVTGGLLVEPTDIDPHMRPLVITRALLSGSDKPLLGSVAGADAAALSLEMVKTVFGSLDRPRVVGLVNINSPLRLDRSMAEALLAYAAEKQPVLLTPGIMMGMTAPVTVAGAMTQAFAELLGSLVLIQVVNPGSPVILGLGGFGADLRSASSGFGRPENALAAVLGAQISRKLGLPFRCSSAVTGSFSVDVRSGYESMLTAWAAWAGGSHFVLQAAGTLDCINTMSYEKFLVDLEVWGYLQRVASQPGFEPGELAMDLLMHSDGGYIGDTHTVEHMRQNLLTPMLAPASAYDTWLESGSKDTHEIAANLCERTLKRPGPEPLDPRLEQELEHLITFHQQR